MSTDNDVLVERVDAVIESQTEIKEMILRLDDRLRAIEREQVVEHVKLEAKADAAHRRLDEHEKRISANEASINALKDLIAPLVTANRIMTWIGGALGISVIALIWALITGQAHILFGPMP